MQNAEFFQPVLNGCFVGFKMKTRRFCLKRPPFFSKNKKAELLIQPRFFENPESEILITKSFQTPPFKNGSFTTVAASRFSPATTKIWLPGAANFVFT